MHRKRVALTLTAAFVLCAGTLIALFLSAFDLRAWLERRATADLGRPVHIEQAELKVSWRPQLVLSGVQVENPPGYSAPLMLDARHLGVGVDLWKFLRGQVTLPHAVMEDAKVELERLNGGRANWLVDVPVDPTKPLPPLADLPEIGRFEIRNTQIHFRDAPQRGDLRVEVITQDSGDPGREPNLVMKGAGTYQGKPAKIDVKGGSALALRSTDEPYPLNATFLVGPTEIKLTGHITDPTNVQGLDLDLAVKGEDAADLYPLLGVSMFATPPYAFTSHLDRDGDHWLLKDFKGIVGKSDVAGKLDWDLSKTVPRLEGTLTSQTLHLEDLAGFIGSPPGDKVTTPEQRAAAAEREEERRAEAGIDPGEVAQQLIVPDRPINLAKLNNMNADVTLTAAQIARPDFPLETLSAKIKVEDGVLTMKPLKFGVEEGKIDINLTVDGRKNPARTDAIVVVDRFPIHRLIREFGKKIEKDGYARGSFGGRIEVHGSANSLHEILAKADGEIGMVGEGGQLSQLRLELLDLDIAEAFGIFLSKDKPVPIRCMAVAADIKQGEVTTKVFVIDTTDTTVIGRGGMNLGTERLDFKIDAKPKDSSIMAVRTPIVVKGTLADPDFAPHAGKLAARAGEMVALGALLTPLAALIPLIEKGGHKDVDCAALMSAQK